MSLSKLAPPTLPSHPAAVKPKTPAKKWSDAVIAQAYTPRSFDAKRFQGINRASSRLVPRLALTVHTEQETP